MESKDLIRYVILGLGRSGTTAVHFALKGHPNATALNDEVKASFFSEGISEFTQRDDNLREKEAGYNYLFDALAGIFGDEHTRAIGMKCIPNSTAIAKELVNSLQLYFPKLKIVLVKRMDIVAQYGSLLRATKTTEWHSWRLGDHREDYSVKIRPFRLRKYVVQCHDISFELERLKATHDTLTLNYEECFIKGSKPDFTQLFQFIGVPSLNVTWLGSEKVAPPPDQYIRNYEALNKKYPY